jgi:cyclophilin family peptidyl-prolyl cis-trans isomerase
LSACGGGVTSAEGSARPAISSVCLSQTSYQAANQQLSLIATANATATAYCFKTSTEKPLAGDTCFQSLNSKNIELTGHVSAYYVWVKDANGTVSDAFMAGPCSAEGFAASEKSQLPTVCMMTDKGEMVFELEVNKAAITVANFLNYVNSGFYSGTQFHRVSTNFVQGGGGRVTNKQLELKHTSYDPITLEKPSATTVFNKIYSIAMARTSVENSATSGFFINLDNNTSFDSDANAYAAFGRLISGTATALAISKSSGITTSDGTVMPDQPPVVQWAIQLK